MARMGIDKWSLLGCLILMSSVGLKGFALANGVHVTGGFFDMTMFNAMLMDRTPVTPTS